MTAWAYYVRFLCVVALSQKRSRARGIFCTCNGGVGTLSRGACETSTWPESVSSFFLSGLMAGSFHLSASRKTVAPWRRTSARDVAETESDAWPGRHQPARACLSPHRIENVQVFQQEASVPPFRTRSVSSISPSNIGHSCPIKTPINHATQNGTSRDLDAQPRDHERWRHVRVWQQVARPRGCGWPGMVGGPYVHGCQRRF